MKEVADRTGVPLRTLKQWSIRNGWSEKRAELMRTTREVETKLLRLRERVIENCLDAPTPQNIFAVAKLEQCAAERRPQIEDSVVPVSPDMLLDMDESEVIGALEEACQLRMISLLKNPGQFNQTAVAAIKSALDMVRDYWDREEKADADLKSLEVKTMILKSFLSSLNGKQKKENDEELSDLGVGDSGIEGFRN